MDEEEEEAGSRERDSQEGRSHQEEEHEQEEEVAAESDSVLFGGQRLHELLRPPCTVYIPERVRLEWEQAVCFTPSTISGELLFLLHVHVYISQNAFVNDK